MSEKPQGNGVEKKLPSRRIADELRAAITSGELPEGRKLESERKLAERFESARNTAREAVRLLAEEGLVDVQHGRGVFVRRKRKLLRFGSERYSKRLREQTGLSPYRAELAKQGLTPRVDCTSIERVVPPSQIAERLEVDPGQASVVRRENWYYASDDQAEYVVQVGVTYIPWLIAEGSVLATSAKMGKGSLYARFEDLGHPMARSREEITARMPSQEEVQGLKLPDGVPVIDVLHTGIDPDGVAFEVTRFVMRADFGGLDYNMPIEG
ncbi:GntR family transcriptional regulator [Nocardiopsis sp. MG754419]|uniref:GntR family transcriptional regulator n=1 Tax=Nocardiopsis sp. MG754419 TaxID=2259865 RepID=UPI001BAA7034|nr:GntR family transcriptional regulator [Nocardiopsis sp. MG754419]MBR8745146.1 GntR family transcriptional regulator [Nocardiopsis sp. MG754419]